MLKQQLLCLIYIIYYDMQPVYYSCMLTHDYTIYAVVVYNIYIMTSLLSVSNILLNILFTCFNFWSIVFQFNTYIILLLLHFMIDV